MAESYATALQGALVAALKADAGVAALVGSRVWDEPPDNPQRPFVRLGAFDVSPVRSACGAAASVMFGVQCHSRPVTSGRIEATRVAEAVIAALNEREDALTVPGFTLVTLHWMEQTADRDDDGKSYLAVVAFDALLDG